MRVVYLPAMIFTHADARFRSFNLTVSTESVGGSTPGVRVTWSTALPPECVTSVTVNFRTTTNRVLVATHTTTNTSQTEIIQTGLQCSTSYYIRVVVTGKPTYQGVPHEQMLLSNKVQVFTGGKEIVYMKFQSQKPDGGYSIVTSPAIPVPFEVRAEVTADNTSIRLSWKWSCLGMLDFKLVRVHYRPEEGSLMMHTVDNTTVTSATLLNLQCNTKYTIWVYARGGQNHSRSLPRMVNLPARGMFMLYNLSYSYGICSTVSLQYTVVYHPSSSHSH